MRSRSLTFDSEFLVALSNATAQAATMTIAAGASEGGPSNRHPGAQQWLFVIAGSGVALYGRRRTVLKRHSLVLIERGERHEIRNTGRTPLKTLNFYVPPAYDRKGEAVAGRGKPARE
jgi:mannose-6-phosphate isomerase-like protein (cupin superfamily)